MAFKQDIQSHIKYYAIYDVVFTPRYIRREIYIRLRKDISESIKKLCKFKGIELLEEHMKLDHVRIIISIPPKYSVSKVMGYIKGKSSFMLFEKYEQLKCECGSRHFWSEGYYVSTKKLDDATINKYILDQYKNEC